MEDARQIDGPLQRGIEDAQAREALARAKNGLVGVARELAANAANTSTSAISLLRLQSGKEAQLEQAVSASAQIRQYRDRSVVVQKILWLYLLSMAASIGYLPVQGLSCKEDEYTTISEIVKMAILPVVTLVIGYYFASTRSD